MECTGKEIMGKTKVWKIDAKKIIRFASGTKNARANYPNDFFVKIPIVKIRKIRMNLI